MSWLLKLLPADKRALLELAIRITSSLDTAAERKAVAEYGLAMFKNGDRIPVGAWARFGSKLGILKGPN
jgi:hypothetical protein